MSRRLPAAMLRMWHDDQPSAAEVAFAILGGLCAFALVGLMIWMKGY